MKKTKPKVINDLTQLREAMKPMQQRGNFVFDKDGKPVFTPTEDGHWIMEVEHKNEH